MTNVQKGKGGRPGFYSEPKERVSVGLTKTGVRMLDDLATQLGLSRSELVEQIARGIIPIAPARSASLAEPLHRAS